MRRKEGIMHICPVTCVCTCMRVEQNDVVRSFCVESNVFLDSPFSVESSLSLGNVFRLNLVWLKLQLLYTLFQIMNRNICAVAVHSDVTSKWLWTWVTANIGFIQFCYIVVFSYDRSADQLFSASLIEMIRFCASFRVLKIWPIIVDKIILGHLWWSANGGPSKSFCDCHGTKKLEITILPYLVSLSSDNGRTIWQESPGKSMSNWQRKL